MANEISGITTLAVTKAGVTLAQTFSFTADMSGDQMVGNIQIAGTVAEAIDVGDVTTIGYLLVKNMDATNYVEVDSASAMDKFPQKIPAGKSILLMPQTATIYAKANTAACNIYIQAVEL